MNTTCLRRRLSAGFTLIELMVVVAIIAILAAIAMPIYSSYVTRSKLTDAQNNLSAVRVSMEQYFQDNRQYASSSNSSACGATMPATSAYFSYSCALTSSGYLITATGIPDTPTANFTFTIDQSNDRATVSDNGWYTGSTTTCWVTSQGVCQ